MSEIIEVGFSRSYLSGVPTHTPETDWVEADYELVTRIDVLGAWVSLHCPGWQEKYQTNAELPAIQQSMSLDMARRLFTFCKRTYVEGDYDYDCHSFVGYLMGWQEDIAAGSARFTKGGPMNDFAATSVNTPYTARAPEARNNVHSFLGTERPGYGLGVVGPGLPLVIGKTLDLKRTFAATELFELSPSYGTSGITH